MTITVENAGEEKKLSDSIDFINATYGVDVGKRAWTVHLPWRCKQIEEARQYARSSEDSATRKIPVGRHSVDAINSSLEDFF